MTPGHCGHGRILITGATGLLGRRLVRILGTHGGPGSVAVLVRRPDQQEDFAAQGIHAVLGDVALPQLGLSGSAYRDLRDSLTGIVHAAANIRFDVPLEDARAVNVRGTSEVLDLARECPKLDRFVHVSTLYVNGARPGSFAEAPMEGGQQFINSYQQSKFEAEQLVLDAMRTLPAAIYRFSMVIADSAGGSVSQFNYFHHLLRLLPRSPLPAIPGDPTTPVDLISTEWAASALAYLFENRFVAGSVRHLCAGPGRSLRFGEAIERTCRILESHPRTQARGPIEVPRLVSAGEFDQLLAGSTDREWADAAAAIGHHVRILAIYQAHLNPLATADLAGSGIELEDPAQRLENTVRYCLDTGWGRRPRPAATN